jgi:hypothetical protein
MGIVYNPFPWPARPLVNRYIRGSIDGMASTLLPIDSEP